MNGPGRKATAEHTTDGHGEPNVRRSAEIVATPARRNVRSSWVLPSRRGRLGLVAAGGSALFGTDRLTGCGAGSRSARSPSLGREVVGCATDDLEA